MPKNNDVEQQVSDICGKGGREARDMVRKCSSAEVVEGVLHRDKRGIVNRAAQSRLRRLKKGVPAKTDEPKPKEAPKKATTAKKKAAKTKKASPAKAGEKTCPKCGAKAKGKKQIEKIFGYRNIKSKTKSGEKTYRIAQSYCRDCRKSKPKKAKKAVKRAS